MSCHPASLAVSRHRGRPSRFGQRVRHPRSSRSARAGSDVPTVPTVPGPWSLYHSASEASPAAPSQPFLSFPEVYSPRVAILAIFAPSRQNPASHRWPSWEGVAILAPGLLARADSGTGRPFHHLALRGRFASLQRDSRRSRAAGGWLSGSVLALQAEVEASQPSLQFMSLGGWHWPRSNDQRR
jgi:hypothetical protein